jgi:hypothetical protein
MSHEERRLHDAEELKKREGPEFEKQKAYLQLERKAKNGWILHQTDVWFNFYLSTKIML